MGDTGTQEQVEWLLILKSKYYIKSPKSIPEEIIEMASSQGDGVGRCDW